MSITIVTALGIILLGSLLVNWYLLRSIAWLGRRNWALGETLATLTEQAAEDMEREETDDN